MAMRLRPGSRKLFCSSLILYAFYWIFLKSRKYTEVVEFAVDGADPQQVWEFWSNFKNWKRLNPNVLDFDVQDEKGNYEKWEYSVKYEETLNLIPIRVLIWGVYTITPEQRQGRFAQPFRITSQHKTCIFMLFCSLTDADMIFIKNNQSATKSTKVIETVDIECMPLLWSFCKKEFYAQRKEILDNVKQIDFSTE